MVLTEPTRARATNVIAAGCTHHHEAEGAQGLQKQAGRGVPPLPQREARLPQREARPRLQVVRP